jgi:tetratricopeptide (TPR) repeat protein
MPMKSDTAQACCVLAKAWNLRGDLERAVMGYRSAIALDPGYVAAHRELGILMASLGRAAEALDCFEQAAALSPHDRDITDWRDYLRALLGAGGAGGQTRTGSGEVETTYFLKDNPEGKISLLNQKTFLCHRSGWGHALRALHPVHNRRGILFDGFIEDNFAWKHWREGVRPNRELEAMKRNGTYTRLATSEEKGLTPYRRPWVGVLHNPQRMPSWFHYQESPQTIFAKEIWKESLPHCLGLFTFSRYHERWLREQTGKPVSVLVHPTEIPQRQFSFSRFLDNPRKKIIQIGWWLRRLSAIYQLPIARDNPLGYEKIRLVPLFAPHAAEYLRKLIEAERRRDEMVPEVDYAENTTELLHVSDGEYDRLLSENLAFVCLYDANANNAVIECIARATPLLVNPLPAVVEYLGDGYPLYFSNLAEAAEKALDTTAIRHAHEYLRSCETRRKLDPAFFLQTFRESEVYRLIP